MMWTLLACGRVRPGAEAELASRLAELLSEPAFGCDHSSFVLGPRPPAPLHAPAGLEPAAA